VAAAAARVAVDPFSPGIVPFATFFPAVLIASLIWGTGPGLLTLALSVLLGSYLWLAPRHSVALASMGEISSLAIFVVGAGCLVLVAHLFNRRSEQLRREASQHAKAQAELAERTAEFEAMLVTVPAGVWLVHTSEPDLVRRNKFAADLMGMPEHSLEPLPRMDTRRVEGIKLAQNGIVLRRDQLPLIRLMRGKEFSNEEFQFLREDGTVKTMLANARPLRDEGGSIVGGVMIGLDITDRKESEEALRRSEERLRGFAASDVIGVVMADLGGLIEDANDEFLRIAGRSREDLREGRISWQALTPPEWHEVDLAHLEEARQRGACSRYEKELLRPDGTRVPILIGFALVGEERNKVTAFTLDLSEQKRAEAQVRLITREMAHRLKNLMTMIGSIANQTRRNAPDLESFDTQFHQRLGALSRAVDILNTGQWRGAMMADAVRGGLLAYAGTGRVNCKGPNVELGTSDALAVSLVVHELVTNAVKYGALSNATGEVEVRWRCASNSNRAVLFEWLESGGPPVGEPGPAGFGTRLIAQAFGAMDAKVEMDFAPEGLRCRITVPLAEAPAENGAKRAVNL
jgi:PAS domain S-box-containing protein